MRSYHYRLTVDAIQFSSADYESQCEFLAKACNNPIEHDCTIGFFSCPFGVRCGGVTKEDWMKVLEPSENNNV